MFKSSVGNWELFERAIDSYNYVCLGIMLYMQKCNSIAVCTKMQHIIEYISVCIHIYLHAFPYPNGTAVTCKDMYDYFILNKCSFSVINLYITFRQDNLHSNNHGLRKKTNEQKQLSAKCAILLLFAQSIIFKTFNMYRIVFPSLSNITSSECVQRSKVDHSSI